MATLTNGAEFLVFIGSKLDGVTEQMPSVLLKALSSDHSLTLLMSLAERLSERSYEGSDGLNRNGTAPCNNLRDLNDTENGFVPLWVLDSSFHIAYYFQGR